MRRSVWLTGAGGYDMHRILLTLVSLTLVVSLVGCAAPSASADELRSEMPREAEPPVATNDIATLADGNNAFAFDLYHEAIEGQNNLFYSPYSISIALAMTYAGASNETERQMAETMHFDLSHERLHPAFNYIDQGLNSRGEGAQGKDGEGFRLNVVNAIWGQKDYSFLQEYLDTLAMNYGAGLRVLDFQNAAEESRLTINGWVEDQTEERIKDLIPEGGINSMTRLVLTNAVYFNAAWASQFEEGMTSPGDFHLLDGGSVQVPMMRQTDGFRYAEMAGVKAVELPYYAHELSMVLLVPDEGAFVDFEDSLDSTVVDDAIGAMLSTEVALTMPKFKLESSLSLNEALVKLGMTDAFSPGVADFSGMDGTKNLFISDLIHKSFVDVDEAGTEAAAATAVVMEATSAPMEPIEMTVDRPFVFLIRDIETGTVLFVGRVMNPS